jgi:hypothetical protein
MFLKTLDISEKTVKIAKEKEKETGFAVSDQRGRHQPGSKKTEDVREKIREHIRSFPALESHYGRASSQKKYLDSNLSVKKMHELYTEKCSLENVKPENLKFYRDIFNTDFNISFHKPKKDACNFCSAFQNMTECETADKEVEHLAHHARKERVREQKEEHKNEAKTSDTVHAVTFDLQQVLQSPKLNVSSLFYKRKLSTYNLTVYSLSDKKCVNYMWHEAKAGRGSCEIATCIFKYLGSLSQQITKVVMYSDTCGGQNRNINFATMCLRAIRELPIVTIEHIFMESGHSQMECDSAHSAIESAYKKVDIYSPTDYYRIVTLARRHDPYSVVQLETADVINYRSMATAYVRNRSKDLNGAKVNWMHIKWLRYDKLQPNVIQFRNGYDGEFRKMVVNTGARGRCPVLFPEASPIFVNPPAITLAKFLDLVSLCDSLAIPRDYHAFYHNLPHSGAMRDALTEPDANEDSETE